MEHDHWSAYNQPVDSIFEQVKRDLDQRNLKGWEQHGKPLTDDVALNWMQEAYEELLDLCIYLRGELNKRERHGNSSPNASNERPPDSV